MNLDAPLREPDLGDVIVQIEEGEPGCAVQANLRGVRARFGACSFIGPELVSGCHRAIQTGVSPVVRACGLERNRAPYVTQLSNAAWRVVIVGGQHLPTRPIPGSICDISRAGRGWRWRCLRRKTGSLLIFPFPDPFAQMRCSEPLFLGLSPPLLR